MKGAKRRGPRPHASQSPPPARDHASDGLVALS